MDLAIIVFLSYYGVAHCIEKWLFFFQREDAQNALISNNMNFESAIGKIISVNAVMTLALENINIFTFTT